MADYTIPHGAVAAHGLKLVANTVTTVAFVDDVPEVEILSDGTSIIYYSRDGSDPQIGGPNTRLVPAVQGVVVDQVLMSHHQDVLKFISPGTPTISVQVSRLER